VSNEQETLAYRLKQAIERIDGVTSASVVLDAYDEVEEIHLVGPTSRRPKKIVRDAESLLCAQFGIKVDYRKISLVQIGPESNPSRRLRLRLIAARPHPKQAGRVQVILQNGEKRYEGNAAIGADVHSEANVNATAAATLDAVQKAIGSVVQLTARDAQAISTADRQVCLAIVSALTPQGEEQLTGTCLVGDSVFEAASKATLDAINRRLVVWATTYGMEPPKGSDSDLLRVPR
jgi:hypothetical protein